MTYQLPPDELEAIQANLPPQFAVLKNEYPMCIGAAATNWGNPPYPEGYIPEIIDVYYSEDALGPNMTIEKGKLTKIEFEEIAASPEIVVVEIDYEIAYIQIRGRAILNRIGGAILPAVIASPELLLKASMKTLPSQ